jgi:hypothetical protein
MQAVADTITERKLRLYLCACAHLCWPLLTPEARESVVIAEGYADGLIDNAPLEVAFGRARDTYWTGQADQMHRSGDWMTIEGRIVELNRHHQTHVGVIAAWPSEKMTSYNYLGSATEGLLSTSADIQRDRCRLLRDICHYPGPPLSSPSLDEIRRSAGPPMALARAIYQDSTFAEMGILADALEDVGFTIDEILGHFRDAANHVRGCWALDLLLGKQ